MANSEPGLSRPPTDILVANTGDCPQAFMPVRGQGQRTADSRIIKGFLLRVKNYDGGDDEVAFLKPHFISHSPDHIVPLNRAEVAPKIRMHPPGPNGRRPGPLILDKKAFETIQVRAAL